MMHKFFVTLAIFLAITMIPPSSVHAAQDKPVVQALGSGSAWLPYYASPLGEPGKPQGIFIELLDILFNDDLKRPLRREFYPWKRAQQKVAMGEADFMVTIPTPERAMYTLKTAIPLYRMYLYLYVYKGHPLEDVVDTIKTADDIKKLGLKLAAHIGDGWYKANIASAGVDTQYARKDDHIVKIVAAGRADGMIEPLLPANRAIREFGLEDKIRRTPVRFGPLDFHVLVSRKSPLAHRMKDINAALKRMKKRGDFERIKRKYDRMKW